VLVAAQRDMIEHLLAAVRGAGLQPVGIDLSAFALIRSLYQSEAAPEDQPEHVSRVVYLNVDGLTNLAIAEGLTCRFTRVVGGGLEGMAGELAERRGIPLTDARAMVAAVDLTRPLPVEEFSAAPVEIVPQDIVPEWLTSEEALPEDGVPSDAAPGDVVPEDAVPGDVVPEDAVSEEGGSEAIAFAGGILPDEDVPSSSEAQDALEGAMSFSEMSSLGPSPEPQAEPAPMDTLEMDADARSVLENGVREISGEVRNSLDFHRSQDGGGEVSHVVLSGAALDLPGFAEALEAHLGLEVRTETVRRTGNVSGDSVSMHRLAVAAGLATGEMHQ
jgi:Tfp pilus assembly PilM family ATPase